VDVWWDKCCLEDGQPWEDGFANGLCSSDIFVPIISQKALAPCADLMRTSGCDNVILEYQLAMEIRHRKRLRAIYPIFVGEKAPADIACDFYTDFFVGKNGGLPSCNDEVVEAIDKKLREHVFRHFQGGPWLPSSSRTVATTLTEICQYQGFRFMGMEDNVLKLVMDRHTPLYSAILRYTPCSSFLACKLSRILGRL